MSDAFSQRDTGYTSTHVTALRPLVQASQRLLAELDLGRLYTLIVTTIRDEIHADRVTLLIAHPDTATLSVAATSDQTHEMPDGSSTPVAHHEAQPHHTAYEPRLPRPSPTVRNDADQPGFSGNSAILVVPLLVGERTLGVLEAMRDDPSPPFSDDEQEVLILLAGQIAMAIEHAQLYDLAQRRTERLDALYRFSTSIAASLDLNVITSTSMQQLGAALPLEQAHLLLIGGAQPAPVQRRSWSRTHLAPMQSVALPRPGSLVARVLSDGVARTERRYLTNGSSHEALAVVLRSEQNVCGVIELVGHAHYHFNLEDKQFVNGLAVPLALAIEKARLHASITASEERYRTILEFANDAVLLLDTQGQYIIDTNRSLEQLSGYSYNALRALGVDVLFEQSWRSLVAAQQTERADALPSTFETVLHTRDSLNVPVSIDISRVPYGDEQLFLFVIRDISARQQAAQQIMQAEKLAAVGRLAASIAHEVNNPLQAIYNSLHLLTKHTLSDEKRQRYLDMTFTEAERLITIVQSLLVFHQPTPEGMRPTQLVQLLRTVLEQYTDQIEQSQLQLVCDWQEPLPRVSGIKSHLKQVFVNLLLNAIEAMPTGGTLTIRVRRTGQSFETPTESGTPAQLDGSASGERLIIEVSDTGQGIAAHELHKIFEPFYTTKTPGTGLGLAISYNIVQQHSGELTATSTVGEGTTFRVSLPAVG